MLVIAHSASGYRVVAGGAGMLGSPTTTGAGAATGGSLNDQYKPRVDAAVAALAASPQNPDIIIQVGHAYFDWARGVYESGQPEASIPTWLAAVSYYDQTLALDPENDIADGQQGVRTVLRAGTRARWGTRGRSSPARPTTPSLPLRWRTPEGLLAELQAAASAPATTPATTNAVDARDATDHEGGSVGGRPSCAHRSRADSVIHVRKHRACLIERGGAREDAESRVRSRMFVHRFVGDQDEPPAERRYSLDKRQQQAEARTVEVVQAVTGRPRRRRRAHV